MEHLKVILIYAIIGIVFNIPLFIKWIKTKEIHYSNHLKNNAKWQLGIILGRLLANNVSIHLLKIDVQIFNIFGDLVGAIIVNILYLFIKSSAHLTK